MSNKIEIHTTIIKYDDIQLLELKQQLKNLEIKLQELIEEKTEYLNDIEEFNTQYNIHLGELIKTILNLKKEILYKKTIKNQKLKEQYKTNKNIYYETKQTIEELKDTVAGLEEILENIDLDNENYEEINNAYNEIKEELEKLEDELLIQENELEKTEEQLKENEIFEEEYEESKSTYEQFDSEYKHIRDTQKDKIKLDKEQQKELKIFYKKAAKLCHPDIVSDEFKEKAHEIMQSLNDAHSKKDIEQVKKILLNLENGTIFKTKSCDIEDKELLQNKIKEFEQNISDLEEEIEHIKLDDTFITISKLDDWDEYFEELKKELMIQKINLEKEVVEKWIQKLWDWADKNNIPNSKLSRQKEKLLLMTNIEFIGLKFKNIPKELCELKNITTLVLWDNNISFLPDEIVNFTNLKKLNLRGNSNLEITQTQKNWIDNLKNCTIYMDEIKIKSDIDIQSNQNKIEINKEKSEYSNHIENIENIKFEKIRKYCENRLKANEADTMQEHLGEQGKMYKALMYSSLEVFIEKLNSETITLCDWGCSQGIASMLVLDYIKEKQLDIKVSDVILIDDDTKALSRAMVQVEALARDIINFIPIKSDDNNISDTIKSNKNNIVLNLFANDKIPISFWTIDYYILNESYFLCVSNENNEFVDEIYENINSFMDVQNLSIRNTKIGKFKKFEKIFKITNSIDVEFGEDEIPF